MIKPGEGMVRFYTGKGSSEGEDYCKLLNKMIREIQGRRDVKGMRYECENRALVAKDKDLELEKEKNKKLSKSAMNEEYRQELAREIEEKETGLKTDRKVTKGRVESGKLPERRLFNVLIAPVYDLMEKLEEGLWIWFRHMFYEQCGRDPYN